MLLKELAVAIPTYKRVPILNELLTDLLRQTLLPSEIIIVDGYPESREVESLLSQFQFPSGLLVQYIPSNHPNAPYQRFLGSCSATNCKWLIFIDDDIRIKQTDVIEKIIAPFMWDHRFVVGISPKIVFPSRKTPPQNHPKRKYMKFMHSSYRLSPGGLTPSGDRVPLIETTQDYDCVEWLRGGVMAYRKNILSKEIYSEDAFALSQIRCGLGADDTFLSHSVGQYGELLQANCVTVEHPDVEASKIFSSNTKQLGYARAYSRRFLNDHYRLTDTPRFSDRLALVRSYLWSFLLNWISALGSFSGSKFAYAWGYTLGIFRALLQRPAARNLTPNIDWQTEAERALAKRVFLA
jgi:glycosyltransferase involved in cell wall biosynthesis